MVLTPWLVALATLPLLVSASIHLREPTRLRAVIISHSVIPYSAHRVAAWAALTGQALVGGCGLLQLLAPMPVPALVGIAATAAYSALTTYVVLVLRTGRDVACGCFGRTTRMSRFTLVRSVALAAAAAGASALCFVEAR